MTSNTGSQPNSIHSFNIKARNTFFLGLIAFSMNIYAMSQSPDDEIEIDKSGTDNIAESAITKSSKELQLINPEEDAHMALNMNDFRLLGFATRSTSIPGIEAIDKITYMEKCGVRLMKGFGDVSRSEKQTKLMHQAYEYAAQYNQLIIEGCLNQ